MEMNNDKIINSMPGLNDIPQRELEFDEFVNVLKSSEEKIKNGYGLDNGPGFVNVQDVKSTAHFIIMALCELPKTTKYWLIKRLILWKIGGNSIELSPDQRIRVLRSYNGVGFTNKQIADIIAKEGYAYMVHDIIRRNDISYYKKVDFLIDNAVQQVKDWLDRKNTGMVPII